MTRFGVAFRKVPNFTPDKAGYTGTVWIIAALISRIESLWSIIGSLEEYRTSMWYGWMLVYLKKHCFSESKRRQAPNDPFKLLYISSVDKLMDKLDGIDGVEESFAGINGVFCCTLQDDESDSVFSIDEIVQEHENEILDSKVVILDKFGYEFIVPTSFQVNNIEFELRTIVGITTEGDNEWDGLVLSRHGSYHSKWWIDRSKQQSQPIQLDNLPTRLPEHESYTLAFIRIEDPDICKIRNQFLRCVGGQTHVQCAIHHLPFIPSIDCSHLCVECGRKEYYRCCDMKCKSYLCKKCFDLKHTRTTSYVQPNNNSDSSDNDDSSGYDSDQTPHPLEEDERDVETNEDEYNDTLIENFLMASQDPVFDLDDDGGGYGFGFGVSVPDEVPTTHAGLTGQPILSKQEYAGVTGNVNISGHVILNQCGTLLTRKKHQIKGSSRHKFFIQKLVATCAETSVPLMYPEATIFPSIHWKMAPDDCSIVGCLPAPLLTEACSDSRFASIQSHGRSRVTNFSCATSSDSRYVFFILCIITLSKKYSHYVFIY